MNISLLFSHIPDGFFSILNGKYKQVYVEILQEIYVLYQESISLIDKDILVDLLCDVMEQHSNLFDHDEEFLDFRTSREKANYFFRKLRDAKWVAEEQMMDYTWKVSVPDYALSILRTFEQITNGHQEEYRGRILSVFQHLYGEEKESYISLQQAYENTVMIINGLKQLNYSIKQHTEALLVESDLHKVLNSFFFDFEEKVLGAYYYRLKSSDHVSKYRVRVLEAVQKWQFDHERIRQQSELLIQDQVFRELHQAENRIYSWLETIEKSFSQMDEILNEIDNRVKLYSRAAEQQIKYHIRYTSGLEEKLNTILLEIAQNIQATSPSDYIKDGVNELISIFSQEFLDSNSWKIPYQSKPKQRSSLVEKGEVSETDKKNEIEKILKRSNQGKTVEQINDFLLRQGKGKSIIPMETLPTEKEGDWLSLIYAIVYSQSKKAMFELSERNEAGKRTIKVGKVTIPHRSFIRKGERK
ncbi:hypothetical protein BACCIP111895_03888 [Neobacillus rhizosphaerae]|uniref:TIGR02677 family protein n=1 Tax=Neobacillus rhizosphaerae TaxID=2880965 RepID=A0ABN8KW70_9BACI|nr:Wadjet anti-phage system protein JetA family protein [Neobacillus rhizosphaerae]CAH2716700.1 hypothetical protein BACCIP111895_03888 [Neobacillus rhizosphaerae]